jgi:VWFA-related protein
MERIVKIIAWSLSLLTGGLLLGWNDGFHWLSGAAFLCLLFAVWFFVKSRRTGEEFALEEDDVPKLNLLRPAVLGGLGAAGCLVYLFLGFLILDQLSLTNRYYERDRSQLEEKIRTLETAGNFEEAAAQIRDRLGRRTSPAWRKDLAANLYRDLVESGKRYPDLAARIDRFREAVAVAHEYDQDDQLAAVLLENAEHELASAEAERVQKAFFEQRVRTLREAGQWSDLATLVRPALAARSRPEWGHPLDSWLYEALYRGGDGGQDLREKRRHYEEALEIARTFNLDPEPATSRLKRLEVELARREELERRVSTFREQGAYEDLVAFLRFNMEGTPRSEWFHPLDRWLYEALIGWGDSLEDLEKKREKFELAAALNTRHGLGSELAAARLKAVEVQIAARKQLEEERNRPAQLPKGTQAGFLRVTTDYYPPVLVADLWVEDAAGALILNLKPKDFQVSISGKPVKDVALAPVRHELPPLHVVLAIDVSGSTQGAPLKEGKKGATAFLSHLKEPKVSVEILSFNKEVHRICDWTDDLQGASSHLQSLNAEGATALLKAVAVGLDDLRPRTGRKRLVVFTDGKDTVGGPGIEELIVRCQKDRVSIDAIGLRSEDLDARALKRLAAATGGEYVEASGEGDIVERYRLTSRRIRSNFYRLVLTAGIDSSLPFKEMPVEIQVGGDNAVSLSMLVPGS